MQSDVRLATVSGIDIDLIFPIVVNSKGRPNGPTFRHLADAGLGALVIVEAGDEALYADALAKVGGVWEIMEVPKPGRGLAYSRNVGLKQARIRDWRKFWVLDDDIANFYRVENQRCVKTDAQAALLGAQASFARYRRPDDVAIWSLEYQQFAWSATHPLKVNSYADVAVLIDTRIAWSVSYREMFRVKVDRDFTLQALALGWKTVRTTRWAFASAKNGSNDGGQCDVYATPGLEAAMSAKMCKVWGPEICTPNKKPDGRPDVKINWGYFK